MLKYNLDSILLLTVTLLLILSFASSRVTNSVVMHINFVTANKNIPRVKTTGCCVYVMSLE